jgi:hypothetical protein
MLPKTRFHGRAVLLDIRRPVLDGRLVVVDHDPAVQHDDVLAVTVAVEVERNLIGPFTEVLEPAVSLMSRASRHRSVPVRPAWLAGHSFSR